MTNEEKAKELANTYSSDVLQAGAYFGAAKMAEWKDQQFKEYLENKIHTIESMKDIDTTLPTDAAVVRTIKEIINELFNGE